MTPTQAPADRADRHSVRLGPLLVATTVLVALALWLVPGLSAEVRSSTTRQAEPYLALSFADEARARACSLDDGVQGVDVRATNRLGEAVELSWVVRAVPRDADGSTPSGAGAGDADSGVERVAAGRSAVLRARVEAPRSGSYDVTVTLVGRSEHLSLVCGGGDA